MRRRVLRAVVIVFSAAFQLFADPAALLNTARDRQSRDDWYAAIEAYQESLRENPSYAEAYAGLAECFYALGEFDKALVEADKALILRKNDSALADLRGFILVALGRLDEARQTFQKVIASMPNDIDARFGLGEIEVASGRLSAANAEYSEALRRNPSNRQALLSLALISHESGNDALARDYAERALRFYGGEPVAHYIYAWLSAARGDDAEAEKHVRNALAVNPSCDDANALLANVLFRGNRIPEVIAVCDARIAADRNSPGAWYLRSLCLSASGKPKEALSSSLTGLEIHPEDEVLRALYETIVMDNYDLESPVRGPAARWHSGRAAEFERKNFSDQAIYEYRRALSLDPYNADTRLAYAKLLLTRGFPALYLRQLEFIQSLGKGTTAVNDSVEAYGKLLASSVQSKWGIDPLYLEKGSTRIGLYWTESRAGSAHPGAESLTARMIGDVFGQEPRFSASAAVKPVSSYSEAFRLSRTAGEDYFALVSFAEGSRDLSIAADFYVSSTGSPAKRFEVYRTGNDRYANALRRLVQSISAEMPIRGKILKRYQGDAVINIGKADGVAQGMKFDVLNPSSVSTAEEGIALRYRPENVLGTFTAVTVEGDVTQGTLARNGFFDRMNPGDTVLIAPADGASESKNGETANTTTIRPPLLDLLRKLR